MNSPGSDFMSNCWVWLLLGLKRHFPYNCPSLCLIHRVLGCMNKYATVARSRNVRNKESEHASEYV